MICIVTSYLVYARLVAFIDRNNHRHCMKWEILSKWEWNYNKHTNRQERNASSRNLKNIINTQALFHSSGHRPISLIQWLAGLLSCLNGFLPFAFFASRMLSTVWGITPSSAATTNTTISVAFAPIVSKHQVIIDKMTIEPNATCLHSNNGQTTSFEFLR